MQRRAQRARRKKGTMADLIRVRFHYEITTPRSDKLDPRHFKGCKDLEDLRQQLIELADEQAEFTSAPDDADLAALWAKVQGLQGNG